MSIRIKKGKSQIVGETRKLTANNLIFDFLFLIVLNSLIVSKGLPFQGILELIDGSLLHRVGHIWTENHIGDDDSFD